MKDLTLINGDKLKVEKKESIFSKEYMDKMGIPYLEIPRKLIHLDHLLKLSKTVSAFGLILYTVSLEEADFPTFTVNVDEMRRRKFSANQIKSSLNKLVEHNILCRHIVENLADHYTWNFDFFVNFTAEEKEILLSKGLGWIFQKD